MGMCQAEFKTLRAYGMFWWGKFNSLSWTSCTMWSSIVAAGSACPCHSITVKHSGGSIMPLSSFFGIYNDSKTGWNRDKDKSSQIQERPRDLSWSKQVVFSTWQSSISLGKVSNLVDQQKQISEPHTTPCRETQVSLSFHMWKFEAAVFYVLCVKHVMFKCDICPRRLCLKHRQKHHQLILEWTLKTLTI